MLPPGGIHLWTWDARPYPIFPAADDVWGDAPNWELGHWLTGRLGGAPLDALVAAILDDADIAGADSSALREICEGYVVDRPMTPRAMIDPLAMAYAFDASAADGTLRFVQRGGAPVADMDEDDLVLPNEGTPARLTRAQETELPRAVSLGFTDASMDYRRSAVTSRRLVGGANRIVRSDLAVVSYDAAATRRAEIWLQDLWAGRESIEFGVGMDRLALAPGDVVAVTVAGRRRLFEIDGLVDTQSRRVSARSIDPDVFAVPLLSPRRTVPAMPRALGPVHALALDLPALDAMQPPVLTRLAVFANPWPGTVTVWRSADGASYQPMLVAAAPATMGETLDALPRGVAACWNAGASLRIRLYGGALTSKTDARVLEGANAAAIRNPSGAWEIVQFAGADLIDAHTYRLSRLLRGQAGSEYAIVDELPAGAPFVVLDEHLLPLARGRDALERPLDLRIVASNRSHDDAAAVALAVTPGATALRPLSPVHVKARRQGDGIHLSWIRRTRIDGDSWASEVPLGEGTEAYALDILSGATVVRSIACAVPAALYANADELTDFGAPQASLRVRVAQLSSAVGAGFPTELTLTL
jgi:hypothetical protein